MTICIYILNFCLFSALCGIINNFAWMPESLAIPEIQKLSVPASLFVLPTATLCPWSTNYTPLLPMNIRKNFYLRLLSTLLSACLCELFGDILLALASLLNLLGLIIFFRSINIYKRKVLMPPWNSGVPFGVQISNTTVLADFPRLIACLTKKSKLTNSPPFECL